MDRRASSETRARERTSVLAAFMTPTVVTPSSIQTRNTYNRTMHDSYFVHDDRSVDGRASPAHSAPLLVRTTMNVLATIWMSWVSDQLST